MAFATLSSRAAETSELVVRPAPRRLDDFRRLAAATDWQTPAARAFFLLADHLAEEVVALGPLADSIRAEIQRARVRAAAESSWDCR